MQIYHYRVNIDNQLTNNHLIKVSHTNHPQLKIVLLGNGQLAKALLRNFAFKQSVIIYHLTRDDVDFYQIEKLTEQLETIKPNIILNAAAYTKVDDAEKPQEKLLAEQINQNLPKALAIFCAQNHCLLVHYSTDYVFNGQYQSNGYIEQQTFAPINYYGHTKAQGDIAISTHCPYYFIFRVAWLYSGLLEDKNFVSTMRKLGAAKPQINVVSDQVGSPTSVAQVARATWHALSIFNSFNKLDEPDYQLIYGTYNLANSGEVSWCDFAKKIMQVAKLPALVEPILSKDYVTLAKRPAYSVLNTDRFSQVFSYTFNTWQNELEICIEKSI